MDAHKNALQVFVQQTTRSWPCTTPLGTAPAQWSPGPPRPRGACTGSDRRGRRRAVRRAAIVNKFHVGGTALAVRADPARRGTRPAARAVQRAGPAAERRARRTARAGARAARRARPREINMADAAGDMCMICHDGDGVETSICAHSGCRVVAHAACMGEWRRRSPWCPVCRQRADPEFVDWDQVPPEIRRMPARRRIDDARHADALFERMEVRFGRMDALLDRTAELLEQLEAAFVRLVRNDPTP